MSLTWWEGGLGERLAWTDGYRLRVMNTPRGRSIEIRSQQTHDEIVAVEACLNHQDFSVADAEAMAETLLARLPERVTEVARVMPATIPLDEYRPHLVMTARAQLVLPGGPPACGFHHAWPLRATSETVCICGRVTLGLARRPQLARSEQ